MTRIKAANRLTDNEMTAIRKRMTRDRLSHFPRGRGQLIALLAETREDRVLLWHELKAAIKAEGALKWKLARTNNKLVRALKELREVKSGR